DGRDNPAFIDQVHDGPLSIGSGATVVSDNADSNAIPLRGSDVDIATGTDPALVGAHRIVSTSPSPPLTGLSQPIVLAIDARGNRYVGNVQDFTVSVFKPGSTSPDYAIHGQDPLAALAVDLAALAATAAGNVYHATSGQDSVSVFKPGSTSPPYTTIQGVNLPFALAIDAAGNLYVANSGGTTVSVFAPGSTTPSATLTGLDG